MFRNTLDHLLDVRDLKRAERENEESGFTLIELLVVVVIIGILIAIAIPLYLNYTKGAKDKGAESDVKAAVAAVQQCYTDHDNQFPDSGAVDSQDSNKFVFSYTSGGACDTEATLSTDTTLVYAPTSDGYSLTGTTKNSKNQFFYDSDAAKVVEQPAA